MMYVERRRGGRGVQRVGAREEREMVERNKKEEQIQRQ